MLRKMLLTGAVTARLVGTTGFTSKAEAHPSVEIGIGLGRPVYAPPLVYPAPSYYPPPVVYPAQLVVVRHHYDVIYRGCSSEPWHLYGVYHSHTRAHEIADVLEHRGYEVRMTHR